MLDGGGIDYRNATNRLIDIYKGAIAWNFQKWGESGERVTINRKKKRAFQLFKNL